MICTDISGKFADSDRYPPEITGLFDVPFHVSLLSGLSLTGV